MDRKADAFYDISLDTIRFSFFGEFHDTTLIVQGTYYYGFTSYKHMRKRFNFIPTSDIEDIEKRNIPRLFIPVGIDSLLLTTTIALHEGTYITHYRENSKIERDSIVVTPGRDPIVVPLEIVLYKFREKGRAVSLFAGY